MIKYFAYGSNMCCQRLVDRVSSAAVFSIGHLSKYALKVNKRSLKDRSAKGNIEFTNNIADTVSGVIFNIDNTQIKTLDGFEGLGKGYEKKIVPIETETNGTIECFTYIASLSAIDNSLLPFDWYINFFIVGAVQNKLPASYIEYLKSFKYSIDTDEKNIADAKRILSL